MTGDVFLGVDQTGALKKPGGDPKPLPAAWIIDDGKSTSLEISHLPSLRRSSLPGLCSNSKLQILVDCVLGLPEGTSPKSDLRRELLAASSYRGSHGLGRVVAENFFKERYPEVYKAATNSTPPNFPKRKCEERASANSVFRARPYQRNIQTGTFRIWTELGADLSEGDEWFSLWSHEPLKKANIGEGYPSHSWRVLTGFTRREPTLLFPALKAKFRKLKLPSSQILNKCTPDQADAVVLAVHLWSSGGFSGQKIPPKKNGEGWIFGLE